MIKTVIRSLGQILGDNYINAVVKGAVLLYEMEVNEAEKLAGEEIDFFPDSYIKRMNKMLPCVGKRIISPLENSINGAATTAFEKASNIKASPLCGLGFLRLGEDGKLYLTSKSEHYHTPLGHAFPGYKLIDNAKALGITNATHNNTRGYITRLLEIELIRVANGLERNDEIGLNRVLKSKEPHVLNRVINLETGSLVCEAGIKMMLARFFSINKTAVKPKFNNKIPVFLVMADNEGGGKANYHGTTIFAQTFRDLWPDLYKKFEGAEAYKVCSVRINDFEDFREKFERCNNDKYKIAGFIHEIILMNYGGIKLDKDYLQKVYALCHQNDTPVMVDEIQSCMWYPSMFLFREYGLNPDFVAVGKGFPNGLYPASRIITTHEMDSLDLFGALVTNGQEELASLAYLITMEFVRSNGEYIKFIGYYYYEKLLQLNNKYPNIIDKIEGLNHLASIHFFELNDALEFASILNKESIDISAQSYKAKCPPAVLTKIPVISTVEMIDLLIDKMTKALDYMNLNKGAVQTGAQTGGQS